MNQLDDLLAKAQPMVEWNDLVIEAYIFSQCANQKDSRILELGAGNGGWCKALAGFGLVEPAWTLVEDFRWAQANTKQGWATTPEDLRASIESFCSQIRINDIYTDDSEVLQSDTLYDIIRIDYDAEQSFIEQLIKEHTTPRSLIFVDDTKMNCGFYRIALVSELMKDRLIHPVWMGEKECVFSIDPLMGVELARGISETARPYQKIYSHIENITVSGRKYTYTVTTDFEIPMVHN